MALRTLKRKIIIREYDYKKIYDQATGLHYDGVALYDRVTFSPLNAETLEKLKLVEILKGREYTPLIATEWNNNVPAMMLYYLKDYLYDERYFNWEVSIDEDGYLCVQARKNTPKSRLGWGIFEKDLVSRL